MKSKHLNVVCYIASDSTAQTYDYYWEPQAGWGQMLDRYFNSDITIKNEAIGGRSTKTFYNEGRLDAILQEIKSNDYLLIQFGHNDSTESRPERYVTVEQYKEYLETYVTRAREKGAKPILITPVGRRDFNSETDEFNVSFPDYVQGMKEVAIDLDVLLVDLSTLSREYYNKIGPEGTRAMFMFVPPGVFEAFPDGEEDNTHFQEYGAIQIARILSDGIQNLDTELSNYVTDTNIEVSDLKTHVTHFKETEEFENESAPHALHTHLDAVNHYLENGSTEKVIKHMEGFKRLLDHQSKKELISDKAYKVLKANSDYVVERFQ